MGTKDLHLISTHHKSLVLQQMLFKGTTAALSGATRRTLKLVSGGGQRGHSFITGDNFGLTEDQLTIQKSALDFAKSRLLPNAAEWDRKEIFPIAEMKEAAALGFAAIYTKAEHGGCELGRLEASLVFEALATGCVSTSAYLSIHNMCSWMIDSFGSNEQRAKWLPGLSKFDLIASYCLTEPNSGSDSAAMQTQAKRDGGDFVLNGSKCFISGGSVSDLYVVMCKTGEKEISTIVVEKGTKGLSFGKKEEKMGWRSQPTTMVIFDDCRVPQANLLGKAGDGFKFAMKGLDGGRINIASCSLGGAAFGLETTREYIQTRKQFKKPLADHQYLQYKLADMATDLSASRAMVRRAAQLLDAGDPQHTVGAAMAKRFATDKCFDIVNYCLQMHGGYGYLNEYPLERLVRDLRVHQILEGTNEIMRLIISRRLLKPE
eukprot:TRINITY_DN5865_c0_g1_i3.p1 TRINITY_DN5865_c0_g1~~TRINITY_DN5865_c0_g1_i3.p1  ORF type:complete len:450 (-),score=97.89 TRINITY_DN5865_c0_g1_i3:119-1414(-)